MSLFENFNISCPKPIKLSRIKSPNPSPIHGYDLNCYIFPMSQKYYKKYEKIIKSGLDDQKIGIHNKLAITRVIEYDYESNVEGLIVVKQDFPDDKSLKQLLSDKSVIFLEIEVIDFMKQIFKIYSNYDYLQNSIKDFSESKIFVYESEELARIYHIQAFFLDETILTQEKADKPDKHYNHNNNKPDVRELALIALKMLSKHPNINNMKNLDIKVSDINSLPISQILKKILNLMLSEESKRPSFVELDKMFFFNPMAIQITSIITNLTKTNPLKLSTNSLTSSLEEKFPLKPLFEIALKRNKENSIKDETRQCKIGPINKILEEYRKIKNLLKVLKKEIQKSDNTLKPAAIKLAGFCHWKIDEILKPYSLFIDYNKKYDKNKKYCKDKEMFDSPSFKIDSKNFLKKWCDNYDGSRDAEIQNKKTKKFLLQLV